MRLLTWNGYDYKSSLLREDNYSTINFQGFNLGRKGWDSLKGELIQNSLRENANHYFSLELSENFKIYLKIYLNNLFKLIF